MNSSNQINQNFENDPPIDVQELFGNILTNWYLFVIFGFIGISVGYIYHRISTSEFEVSTTVLISEDNSQMNSDFLFQKIGFQSSANVLDQIGILSTYMLNLEAINQLEWNAAWFKQDLFRSTDLYKSSPFEVVKLDDATNLPGVPVYITRLDSSTYRAEVDDDYISWGTKMHVELNVIGKFGVPLRSENFNFIIRQRGGFQIDESVKYYFLFYNVTSLANFYKGKVAISQLDPDSNLITLKIQGSNTQRLVDFLNTLTSVFIQFGLSEKNKASENTVKFIDFQLSGIVDSLQQAGRDFTDFRTQNKVIDLTQEAGFIMDRLKEVESTLATANMRLDYYKNLLKYLGDAKQMEQMVAPSVVGITDVSLNSMVTKLGELYSRRNILAFTAQEKNPSIVAIDNEIVYLQQSLQEFLKNSISNTEVEIQNLEERRNSTNIQLSRLPKTEQNMVNIKRNFDLNNELYTFLLQKRAEAAIAKASTTPDVQVLDIARIENATIVGPGKMIKLLFGLFMGLCVPAVIIVISIYFNNKITKKAEIDSATSIPTIGIIAHNHLKTDFPVLKYPNSGVTESFRSIRTNLQYLLDKNSPNMIAIQSMISGEGKSFVALNLALAFAINDKRTLLVDGDLRKPQLHYSFKHKNETGLSPYLMEKATFNEIVQESKIKNLSFVTTGPFIRSSSELLDSNRLKEFISEAKLRFDLIIFNNSPISVVTDGVLVGNLADTNVIVLRQNFSYKSDIKLINQFKEQGAIKNICLIFNDVKISGQGYYSGGRGGGYGYFSDANSTKKSKWKFKPSKETLDHV